MKVSARLKYILPCFLFLFSVGCDEYDPKAKAVAEQLKVGMSKSELDQLCKDLKFLKEQTVLVYPNSNESKTRAVMWNDQHWESIYPKDLIDQLTFDGNTKVYSYLIKREKVYANPVSIDYLAVFYNQNADKVIGWGHLRTSGDVETWDDRF
jgi:hypothetical protein